MEDRYYKWYFLLIIYIVVCFLIGTVSRATIKGDLREIKQTVQCSQGLSTEEET